MEETNGESVNSPNENITAIAAGDTNEVKELSLQEPSPRELSYIPGWQIYGLGWSLRPDKPYRLAIGSFIEGTMNRVQILHIEKQSNKHSSSSLSSAAAAADPDVIANSSSNGNEDVVDDDVDDDDANDDVTGSRSRSGGRGVTSSLVAGEEGIGEEEEEVRLDFEFNLSYPTTKIMWIPDVTGAEMDLFATGGDFLRLWEVTTVSEGCSAVNMRHKLSFKKKDSDYCSPVTSFDWNKENLDLLGTSSVDTTCTIWSVETQKILSQLIAHDKEVYDMAFASKGTDIFGSVGADGSLRLFDLRCLEHSAIVYESPDLVPLLKLAWNPVDPNYIAVLQLDSNRVAVVDIRNPAKPYAELTGHSQSVNDVAWAPNASNCLATCGEDKKVLV